MITPKYLKAGDKIGIVAPARKVTPEEIQPGIEMLQRAGFTPVFGKNLFKSDNQFSGTDEERTEDLQHFLNDNSIRAIISVRGGYGTLRIIDQLDFSSFKNNPKWIAGYSDITILHSHIHQQLGIETLHSQMVFGFLKDSNSTNSLIDLLQGKFAPIEVPLSNPLNRIGRSNGLLVGGNLSILYALQGSNSDLDTQGKILFLEDLDEYLYHIDRMMLSLKRSGKLKHLAGLVVGDMLDMKDNTIPFGKNAQEIIREAVDEFDFPVCFDFPCGHGTVNRTLPLGRKCTLEVNASSVVLK